MIEIKFNIGDRVEYTSTDYTTDICKFCGHEHTIEKGNVLKRGGAR